MNRKSIYIKLLSVIISTTLLYSCKTKTTTPTATTTTTVSDTTVASSIGKLVTYDANDYYTQWKNETPNYVKLTGTSATLEGSGATIKDNKITITKAGVYVISGKLADGQIIVDVADKGSVKIVLNGAQINNSTSSAIYVKSAEKAIISLEAGTDNIISDGKKYVLADASEDEPNAAIYSKDDLTINGTGKLTVTGNYNDGITSKDDLKITGGNIKIISADDGLLGKDIVAVKAGTIAIESGGDGIKASNDTNATKGSIALEGGTFNIKSQADGMQANTSVLISGGTFTITTGGGSAKAAKKSGDDMGKGQTSTTTADAETETQSAKGIKASTDISIGGGSLKIDSADDALHSSKTLNILSGDVEVSTGDDAVHADELLTIKNGKVNITKSYEGLESDVITISGGEIHVIASDDGINAAAGSTDESSTSGDAVKQSAGDSKLNINGGYITVDATGDGLDSNGSIAMTKGTVIVYGPTNGGNGSLDFDGKFVISGGTLMAVGSSGMAQAPSEESTQYSVIMTYTAVQKAGTLVHLQDKDGTSIGTFTPTKDYQTIVISSPTVVKGSKYSLYTGGATTSTQSATGYTDGKYTGGTKVVDFTIADSVTWLTETGITTAKTSSQGGPRGSGNPGMGGGGMRDPEAMKTAYETTLKSLVSAKTISQAQADKVLAASTENMPGGGRGGARPDGSTKPDGAQDAGEKPDDAAQGGERSKTDSLSELVTSKVITQAQADTINLKLQEAIKPEQSSTTK
ncbi:carbohydrate-binding domain-containing protein [Clostridium lacusfryxellense]|uniref:carbohydrate-binding domain-containing protein n=1 Tax=Clostridium lacusfryxellense TaxID=205328 RepID=UPI001C0B3CA3|nr:carbohydrate-binding domain-containing protein [Clostridium lacusfryxellense]MBU3114070.1 carbohydrate-binding domain-containing protein [Clostridium lacusfryxellense]